MKLISLFFFYTICITSNNAQNLIFDSSMEIHAFSPDPFSVTCDSAILTSVTWKPPCLGMPAPDYEHENIKCTPSATNSLCCVPFSARGFQWPKNGLAYFFVPFFEYSPSGDSIRQAASLRGKITDTLINSHIYCFSMYVSAAENFNLFTNQIGVFFSKSDFMTGLPTIDSIPQLIIQRATPIIDTSRWTLLNGKFVAEGSEKFITIGLFESQKPYPIWELYPDSISGFIFHPEYNYPPLALYMNGLFIDMVSLYDCTGFYYEADAGENTELCKGSDITLGWDENTNRTFKWSVVSGDSASLINDSIPRPTVNPQETTVYALYVIDEYVQEHYDTVIVEVIDCANPVFVPNIFSPNGDGQNDVLYVRSTYIKELKDFRVYNRWGEQIFQCHAEPGRSTALEDCGWNGTYKGEDAPTGVYAYYVEAVLVNGETVIKRGNVTLVR